MFRFAIVSNRPFVALGPLGGAWPFPHLPFRNPQARRLHRSSFSLSPHLANSMCDAPMRLWGLSLTGL